MQVTQLLPAVLAVSLVAGIGLARADDTSQADALFAEGLKLKEAGKPKEACDKFGATLRLNPNAVGAILNVALCDEEGGKYASATRRFSQARDLAREHDLKPELKAAEEHIQADEPFIAHLSIAFAETPPADAKIVIDDDVIPIDRASDILVDPGTRTITVTAPGRVAYETKVTLAKTERKAIAVPKLAYPVTIKNTRITYGKVLTFGGAAFIAGGVVFGLVARSEYNKEFEERVPGDPSSAHCNKVTNKCDADGYQQTHTARTVGNIGTGVGIAGAVALGTGLFLWVFAPRDSGERHVAVTPTIGPDGAGVVAVGQF